MTAFFEGRLEARVAELEAMNRTLAEELVAVSTRLATAEADRDDYERRWLAECREHGEAKRRLMLAHNELGEHSLCNRDCCLEPPPRGQVEQVCTRCHHQGFAVCTCG